jgi:dihydroorotase
LLVRDGKIEDAGGKLGRPDGATVVNGEGAILCPGLVDMRAEVGEPGDEYRETIASAALAAAAGGITTLATLPNTRPAIDDPALVRLLRARGAASASCRLLPPHGAAAARNWPNSDCCARRGRPASRMARGRSDRRG